MHKILFYCSGGGFGHLARSDAAIAHLVKDAKVILASKEVKWPFKQYENFEYVKLENVDVRTRFFDDLIKVQVWHGEEKDLNPYRKHLIELFNLIEKENPDVVVVDSTPEIAIMVKLMGKKVVYVYETLEMKENELRFDLAWKNADKIVFPYPEYFADPMNFSYKNTRFCGGYCRMENEKVQGHKADPDSVLVSFGKGEKCDETLRNLVGQLKKKYSNISVLSGGIEIEKFEDLDVNFINADPESVLEAIEKSEVYICGAGYNTVMEGFYLNKRMVAIPLERPYNEQIIKAKIFAEKGALELLMPEDVADILESVSKIKLVPEETLVKIHREIVDGLGSKKAADEILKIAKGEK